MWISAMLLFWMLIPIFLTLEQAKVTWRAFNGTCGTTVFIQVIKLIFLIGISLFGWWAFVNLYPLIQGRV